VNRRITNAMTEYVMAISQPPYTIALMLWDKFVGSILPPKEIAALLEECSRIISKILPRVLLYTQVMMIEKATLDMRRLRILVSIHPPR
jgi:hypothetical protein